MSSWLTLNIEGISPTDLPEQFARKISSLFTSETDKHSPEGEMTFCLTEKAIATTVVELHDYIGLSFSEIAQCFPFTRKQIEEMYHEYEEEYPHVE